MQNAQTLEAFIAKRLQQPSHILFSDTPSPPPPRPPPNTMLCLTGTDISPPSLSKVKDFVLTLLRANVGSSLRERIWLSVHTAGETVCVSEQPE